MNTVAFPGFNLKFNINRIAFTIFGINIYWYGLIMVTAIVIGIIVLKIRNGTYDIEFNKILDLLLFLIPISIMSARAYYVIFNLKYYLSNPAEIINMRNGGMAIYGGIIGGIITCVVYCKKTKTNLLDIMDYLAPALVLGQAIGRWGNFVNVEAYGTLTTAPWRMGIYEASNYLEVHPTFLYESITCFMIFMVLLAITNKRRFKGQITCTYLLLYSIERTFVEGLRTDSLMLGTIRISQVLSIVIFTVSLTILIKQKMSQKSQKSQ